MKVKCPVCDGRGEISYGDHNAADCTFCKGTGVVDLDELEDRWSEFDAYESGVATSLVLGEEPDELDLEMVRDRIIERYEESLRDAMGDFLAEQAAGR